MRLIFVLLLGLAASAAHGHDEVVFPELPIPEIDQLFPVDSPAAAFRWADISPPRRPSSDTDSNALVVALSESQFGQVNELLAGIQQPQNSIPFDRGSLGYAMGLCEGLDGRFGVYLQGWSQGGVDDEALLTLGAAMRVLGRVALGDVELVDDDVEWDINIDAGGLDWGLPSYLLKNRYTAALGYWDAAADLRDTGFSMRFRFTLVDNVLCAGEHTSHTNGSRRHNRQEHPPAWQDGPYTDWIPIADLLDGDVALRAELRALRGDLAAVRDSVAWLSSRSNTGGDTTAVRPSSWGAIKALVREE